MDRKADQDQEKKKHYLHPVKKTFPSGDVYYVLLSSESIASGKPQNIHFEVESKEHADRIIADFARTIGATNDNCIIGTILLEEGDRFVSTPRKIEAGFYEYRGYEIVDRYDPLLPGGFSSKKERWEARKKPWADAQRFGRFDRLRDAVLQIDLFLDKIETEQHG